MKEIKILGPGCRRCEQLAASTRAAADQLGIEYQIEKVTEITVRGLRRWPTPLVRWQGEVPGQSADGRRDQGDAGVRARPIRLYGFLTCLQLPMTSLVFRHEAA
jgi:hypothetical protein